MRIGGGLIPLPPSARQSDGISELGHVRIPTNLTLAQRIRNPNPVRARPLPPNASIEEQIMRSRSFNEAKQIRQNAPPQPPTHPPPIIAVGQSPKLSGVTTSSLITTGSNYNSGSSNSSHSSGITIPTPPRRLDTALGVYDPNEVITALRSGSSSERSSGRSRRSNGQGSAKSYGGVFEFEPTP